MALLEQPEYDESDGEIAYVDVPETEEDKTLSAIFGEFTDNEADILIKVYRINEMGKEAHCFDTIPSGLDGIEDRLRDAYGRGDYKLKAFGPTPQGKKSIKKVVKLTLETPMEKEIIAPVDTGGDVKAVMVEMARQNNESQMNIMQMFKEQQLETQNRMQEAQMRMQELLISTMGSRSEPPSLTEQLALLKQLQPEQKDPMEYMTMMFDMNSKMQEMASPVESTPLGELSSGINSLVKLAAQSPSNTPGQPAIKGATQSPVKPEQKVQQQPSQQPQPPQAQPGPANQQANTEMNLNHPMVRAKLQQQLQSLMQKAHEDKNPEIYALLMVEELPEQFYSMLLDAIGHDNATAIKNFADIEPGIMQFEAWFNEFVDGIRMQFVEATDLKQESGLNDGHEPGHNVGILDSNQTTDAHTTTTTASNEATNGHESDVEGDSVR